MMWINPQILGGGKDSGAQSAPKKKNVILLKKTIKTIRDTELSLGNLEKQVLESEKENRVKLRKSIVANTEIKQGAIINKEMIAIKRPGSGIPPGRFEFILGRKATVDIPAGTVMSFEMINGE